ncbi:MAG: TRAP transporter substrate-binding protein [Alphaproteobacteria bacterium]|nr:TRAP transporter substrate-binding protein [Alphaproteobacteria bacterium]
MTVAVCAAVALGGATASAQTQNWKLQTSAQAGDFYYKTIERWLPVLTTMTGGKVKAELTPIGSVVPHNQTIDAVAQGILQGDLTSTVYFSGRDKAFALMGDLIAGYDNPWQLIQFCYYGGGREILQELFDKYTNKQVKVVGCATGGKEAFISKVPIRKVDDFKGKKIRSPEGLAADVFRRAGAAPVAMPPSETYTALDKGVVDAADDSTYSMTDSVGLFKVAKFPIYPGIHSMPILQFTVNMALWNKLSPAEQAAVDGWYRAAMADLVLSADIEDRRLVARDRADKSRGIEIIDWPQGERDKFREIAAGAWKDFAQGSDIARKAYEANIKFMKQMNLLPADFQ